MRCDHKMKVNYAAISGLFRLHDIDGLISSGAPVDEYEPEVERIVTAFEKTLTRAGVRDCYRRHFCGSLGADAWRARRTDAKTTFRLR